MTASKLAPLGPDVPQSTHRQEPSSSPNFLSTTLYLQFIYVFSLGNTKIGVEWAALHRSRWTLACRIMLLAAIINRNRNEQTEKTSCRNLRFCKIHYGRALVAKSRIGDKAGILSNFGIQTVPDRYLCPQKPAAAVDRPMETHTWDSEKTRFSESLIVEDFFDIIPHRFVSPVKRGFHWSYSMNTVQTLVTAFLKIWKIASPLSMRYRINKLCNRWSFRLILIL